MFYADKVTLKYTIYQRKVAMDMLNAVKSMLADVSSEQTSSQLSGTSIPL